MQDDRAKSQPTPSEVTASAGGTRVKLGSFGIKSKTITVDGKTVRVYGIENKEKIEKILEGNA